MATKHDKNDRRNRTGRGSVTTCDYQEVDHLEIIDALAKPFADWAPVQRDVFEFIAAISGDFGIQYSASVPLRNNGPNSN